MKSMKKLACFILTLIMVLSLASVAYAAEEKIGTITITNPVPGQTYKAYQILYLESYTTDGKYAYKANSNWKTWLKTQTDYVKVDDNDYVTWVGSDDSADFAKAAKAQLDLMLKGQYQPDGSEPAGSDDTPITINNLKLGYYLVDTTLGSLCSLDTTNPDVEITEKNAVPTINKEVQEDSNSNWGKSNDADIGQTVTFRTTVHAKPGAENYVVHDVMSEGLTFSEITSVKGGGNALTKDTHYTVSTNISCNKGACDFHIVFTQTYLDAITTDTDIVIEYTAILNEKAVIHNGKNTNDTCLEYGDKNSTEWSHTDTYTYMFDLIKTDGKNTLLDGAEFKLYASQSGTDDEIALVKETGDGNIYRVATKAEKEAEGGFASATIATVNGQAVIKGLDGGTTYYLEETKAPNGYNRLSGRQTITLTNTNLTGTVTGDTWESGGVHIINNSGSELPATGGIGTTIFYIVGGTMVLAAAVLLVTKKRMNSAN